MTEHPRLTKREEQILAFVQYGWRNREIAAKLSLSEAMIKLVIRQLLKKYRVKTRLELVVITKFDGRDLNYPELPPPSD